MVAAGVAVARTDMPRELADLVGKIGGGCAQFDEMGNAICRVGCRPIQESVIVPESRMCPKCGQMAAQGGLGIRVLRLCNWPA
jgi:hypothetical protein